jgi:hypothetical protein
MTIGIDPGKTTGLVIYNEETNELQVGAFTMADFEDFYHAAESLKIVYPEATVAIEDPGMNRPTFSRPGTSEAGMRRISRNVGANIHSAKIIIAAFKAAGFQVFRYQPQMGKWSKEDCEQRLGEGKWKGRCNEHTRDAFRAAYSMRFHGKEEVKTGARKK